MLAIHTALCCRHACTRRLALRDNTQGRAIYHVLLRGSTNLGILRGGCGMFQRVLPCLR